MPRCNNIMIAIPTLASGGAERVASIWANGLANLGQKYNIYLFTLYEVKGEYSIANSVNRINLCENETAYRQMSAIEKIFLIRNILKKNDISVVIGMVTYIGIIFNIARFGTHTKLIETIRNNPQLVPNSKKLRIIRDISVRAADGCIFQNNDQRKYFDSYNKHSAIIPNPVSDEFLESVRVYREAPHKIIALGRLHEQKNFEMLLAAFKKLKNYNLRLDIYGEGPEKEKLQEIIDQEHLNKNVRLDGRTTEVLDKLLESDIYVLCSNYEGMPNVLMEAMATGIPSISTNCPTGPSDLIKNGLNGTLIECGNIDALVKAIKDYIFDYRTAISYGQKAKQMMKNYKDDNIVKYLDEFVCSVI